MLPILLNKVQIPQLNTNLQGLVPAHLSSLSLIPLASLTLPGSSHPKLQEQLDTMAPRQLWSQPG